MGKSTIASRIAEEARRLGCRVGGIHAPEVRRGGRRVGFQIVDVATGARGWLARRGPGEGPRIGSYHVIVEDVVNIGVEALRRAVEEADLILLDEIGPMELAVAKLRQAIVEALESGKPVVGVVHRRLRQRDPEIYRLVEELGPVIRVTLENRDRLLAEAGRIARSLCGNGGAERGKGANSNTRP